MTPSVGRIVHYVSYGTPGGEYASICRAAIVTEVNGRGADDAWRVSLAVLNPEGMFFNRDVPQSEDNHRGGTWHWPERVPALAVNIQVTSDVDPADAGRAIVEAIQKYEARGDGNPPEPQPA